MKKKTDGKLVDTNALLLTFCTAEIPESLKLRPGFSIRVRQYIPLPRRCFKCQRYGHVGKFCRSNIAICVNCGLEEHEGTDCIRSPTCINCEGAHAANYKQCDRYKFEKEILAIKTKERLAFREAKEEISRMFVRPGVTFATALSNSLRRRELPQARPRDHQTAAMSSGSPANKREEPAERLREDHDMNNNISLRSISSEYASPIRNKKRNMTSSSIGSPTFTQNEKKPKAGPSCSEPIKDTSSFNIQTGLESFNTGSFLSSSEINLYPEKHRKLPKCSEAGIPAKVSEKGKPKEKTKYPENPKHPAPHRDKKSEETKRKTQGSTSKIDTLISPTWR